MCYNPAVSPPPQEGGKTSLLNHLLAHQDRHLLRQRDQPPLLARIDLQGISHAARFYGIALRELVIQVVVHILRAIFAGVW